MRPRVTARASCGQTWRRQQLTRDRGSGAADAGLEAESKACRDGALGAGAQFGVLMPFSRKHESEADEIGLIYMARAGYDPQESIRFWQRMEQAGRRNPPGFLSTHPSRWNAHRATWALMPKALEEYQRPQQLGVTRSA